MFPKLLNVPNLCGEGATSSSPPRALKQRSSKFYITLTVSFSIFTVSHIRAMVYVGDAEKDRSGFLSLWCGKITIQMCPWNRNRQNDRLCLLSLLRYRIELVFIATKVLLYCIPPRVYAHLDQVQSWTSTLLATFGGALVIVSGRYFQSPRNAYLADHYGSNHGLAL